MTESANVFPGGLSCQESYEVGQRSSAKSVVIQLRDPRRVHGWRMGAAKPLCENLSLLSRHGSFEDVSSGKNIMHPRAGVLAQIGVVVRKLRLDRRWSQERLARRVGVHRRTVMRLEKGLHVPGPPLVHALEAVFDERLTTGWKEATPPSAPSYGPRARFARRIAGVTLLQAATAAGVSRATMSRFEREISDSELIMGRFDEDGGILNDTFARALGFDDASEMTDFCRSTDIGRWRRVLETRAG